MMHYVALLIGGNQGDRHALIEQATVLIQKRIGTVVAVSKVYETEPWGEFDVPQQNFFNRALLVETQMAAHDVLREALAIEKELGRERLSSGGIPETHRVYHSRPMDIDIIFYDDAVIDTAELTIPHPRMQLRRFVLEPLAEIMPDYRHPRLDKNVRELLEELQ